MCKAKDELYRMLNVAKSLKIRPTMDFKILKFPSSASTTALEFLHNKGNCVGFTKLPKNVYALRHGASY